MSEQVPDTGPAPAPGTTPSPDEKCSLRKWFGRRKQDEEAANPKSFDLDVSPETWDRLQARLRSKYATTLLIIGVLLIIAAGVTWTLNFGQSSESKTVTTVVKGGVLESETTVTQSSNPLIALSVGMAVLGVVALAPSVTWAIVPGGKIGAGGFAAEGGASRSPALESARPKVGQAKDLTLGEVDEMVVTTSSFVDQQPLPDL